MVQDYINAKAPPLRRVFNADQIGTETYRKAVARLSEDAQRKIESLEALLNSGGYRLLCELAVNEAAAQVARLDDISPTDAASVAEIQRAKNYAGKLSSAVIDTINLIAADERAFVDAAAERIAKAEKDAEERTWRDF